MSQPWASADHALSTRRAVVRSALRATLTVTGLVGLYFLVPVGTDLDVSVGVLLVAGLVGVGALLTRQVRSITRSASPGLRAIEVLATSLPLFLLLFSLSYVVLGRLDDAAFSEPLSRLDALYFTLTVFATVGFGDITAVSATARAAVTAQIALDLILIGLGLRVVLGAVEVGRGRASPADQAPLTGGQLSPPERRSG